MGRACSQILEEITVKIYDVKINGMRNPVGCIFDILSCSWKVKGVYGKQQKNVRIEVSLDEDFSDVIYVKEGAGLDSLAEPIELELIPYTRYFYRITVETDQCEIVTSDVYYFETAKMNDEWKAKWIGIQQEDDFHPEFTKTFSAKQGVKKARLYITGIGLFEAYVNNEKAGNDFLAPFINDYKEHLQYCTYDITDSIREENEITVRLGDGWYKGRFGFTGAAGYFGKEFTLIAEIRIFYRDGSVEEIGTDDSWKYRESAFAFTDIYDGEIQDYLNWHQKAKLWKQARIMKAPVRLTERYSLPVHEMEQLPVKEILYTPAGETVLDFGQNFAGYIKYSKHLPKGTVMKLEFGEILQKGNFYHDNYRTAKSEFVYVSDGKSRVIQPHFTFYAFRYIKVTGIQEVCKEDFIGVAVYSEMKRTGFIETSDAKINQLYSNTVWGLKSNFLDMPTDCPQRDERLGWCGDAQVFSNTASFHMDTKAFYQKFLRDLRSDQLRHNGKVALYLPNTYDGMYAAVWSDAGNFIAHMLYEYYGDKEALRLNYPLMKDWTDCLRKEDIAHGDHYLYDWGFQFGDWLALDGATEQSNYGRTDNFYIASMYYYASTVYTADAAKVLDKVEDAEKYSYMAAKIKEAILDEFYSPSGRLTIDTQTGYLVALKFGVYRDKQRVIDGLKNRIKRDCFRIKGGFVGATMMNTVLAENGMTDLAYDFLFFKGFPGWLYEVNLGATTIWERWNSVLEDGTISGTSMNSLNHYAYGAVAEFMYRHIGGIIPKEPGFRKVEFAPKPDARLKYFKCTYESAAGKFVSNWKINEDGTLRFHFEVPFGTNAAVTLPDSEKKTIELQAGQYDFNYKPARNYMEPLNENTRVELLVENKKARGIINKYLPSVSNSIEKGDLEEMSDSLAEMRRKNAAIGFPTDDFDKAIEEIRKIRG